MPTRLLILLATAALVLGACSSGGDDSRPAPTPSASCTATGDPGTSTQTLQVAGEERSYLVQTPNEWDGKSSLPVVYMVHGLGGQADTTLAYTGLGAQAEEHDFIVVAPQARSPELKWDFRTPASEEGSDAAFLQELVGEVAQRWCVDEDRQFAAGLSNGSAVVMSLACSGDFPFKAYGAVAAAFYDDASCKDSPPASIVYFHGTADRVVPFEGGPTPIELAPPVEESLAAWAEHDGCTTKPAIDEVADDVERTTWKGCDDGSRLEAYYIEGGGHTWPGAVAIPTLGVTTESIDAAEIMTEFFGLAG